MSFLRACAYMMAPGHSKTVIHMALKTSLRSDIPVFRVLDILRAVNERCAAGEDIIHLEAGQPSFGAPAAALDKACRFINENPCIGYTEALGIPALRERIAQWYQDRYGLKVKADNIAVTLGASGGFLLSFLGAFDAGDKVALATPGYPAYRNILMALDITPVEIATGPETDYQITAGHLKNIDEDIDGLIVASPSNPTGTIIAPDEIRAIADHCKENSIRIIADEIYHNVTYGAETDSLLQYSCDALVLNSFSKYFAMTGWRLGWIVMPDDLVQRIKSLAESMFIAPATLSQYVALETFEHTDTLDGYVECYRENLDILKRRLPEAGLDKFSDSKGAFYLYVDISDFTNDSEAFCRRMIDEAGVACTPGVDFDPERGHRTMRISFVGDKKCIETACDRLTNWLQAYKDQNSPAAKKTKQTAH